MTQRPEELVAEALLNAIDEGRTNCLSEQEVVRLRGIAREIKLDKRGAAVRMQTTLLDNGALSEAAIDEMTRITLEFVSKEIEKYSNIRAVRELTDEEKYYGQNILPQLLGSLRSLLGIDSKG